MTANASPIELLSLVALACLFLLWTAELLCVIWVERARVPVARVRGQGGSAEHARMYMRRRGAGRAPAGRHRS